MTALTAWIRACLSSQPNLEYRNSQPFLSLLSARMGCINMKEWEFSLNQSLRNVLIHWCLTSPYQQSLPSFSVAHCILCTVDVQSVAFSVHQECRTCIYALYSPYYASVSKPHLKNVLRRSEKSTLSAQFLQLLAASLPFSLQATCSWAGKGSEWIVDVWAGCL